MDNAETMPETDDISSCSTDDDDDDDRRMSISVATMESVPRRREACRMALQVSSLVFV